MGLRPHCVIMAKLVWTKTGDEMPLVLFNSELYSYFVSQLDAVNSNRFLLQQLDFSKEFDTLKSDIDSINKILTSRFHITDFDFGNIDCLDQSVLNNVHRVWVKLHQKFPNIGNICEQVEKGSNYKFYRINKTVHFIEDQFNKLDAIGSANPIPNIFSESCLMYGRTNIMIEYNNLGRSTYNKWLNFDSIVADSDTNDFKELYSTVSVNLARPLYRQPPIEYVNWCENKNVTPVAENIGLANFDNLEQNLLSYRNMIYYNSQQESNFLTFKD